MLELRGSLFDSGYSYATPGSKQVSPIHAILDGICFR
jgi:hypothetical protein